MIELSKTDRAQLVVRLQDYMESELDQTLDQFAAEFLLDFLTRELGPYYYNQGLLDAQALLEKRLESITEAIGELEQPTSTR
ncbi:MAG: DUF2164 domain-containing protein [Pseudomonadota bacterium]